MAKTTTPTERTRRRRLGWFLLGSGVPFHGQIPPGAQELTEAAAKAAAKKIAEEAPERREAEAARREEVAAAAGQGKSKG